MNPTARVLALLMLGVSVVYAQNSAPSDTVSRPSSLFQRSFNTRFLTSYPSRELQSFLTLDPGIAEVNGIVHVRGSRGGQTGYILDGFNILDRYSNSPGIVFIPEAMESVTAHTGVYDPSLGMNGGGIVEMRMKEGGDAFRVTAKYLTDDVRKPGEPFLDTYSYGWNTVIGTVEGPLPFGSSFFVAGEIQRARDREPRYVEPMHYEFVQDQLGSYPTGTPLPYPFNLTRNHVPQSTLDRYTVQWNLGLTFMGVHANVLGSISESEQPVSSFSSIIQDYYRLNRTLRTSSTQNVVGLTLQTAVTNDIDARASIGFVSGSSHNVDPDFGEDWALYTDSAANAVKGFEGFPYRFFGPPGYSVVHAFFFDHPSEPNRTFARWSSTSTQASASVRWRANESIRLDAGLEAEWWTARKFSVSSIPVYLQYLHNYYSSSPEAERVRRLDDLVENIGYDVYGIETDAGLDRARTPLVGAAFVGVSYGEDGLEFSAGIRQQLIGQDLLRVKPPVGDPPPYTFPAFDESLNPPILLTDAVEFSPVIGYTLPRVTARYTMEAMSFVVGAGLFVDAYRFSEMHRDILNLSRVHSIFNRVSYNLSTVPRTTYLARPERTSLVEAAWTWNPVPHMTIASTVYKKTLSDQLVQGSFQDAPSNIALTGLVNEGESSIYGWESSLALVTPIGLRLGLVYGYTDAMGKAPDPSDWSEVSDEVTVIGRAAYPDLMVPLPYAQKHRALLSIVYDAERESPLEGVRAGVFGRFLSGHPYTREAPIQNLGAAYIWRLGTRSMQDVRSRNVIESYYASEVPASFTWDLHLSYRLELGLGTVTARIDVTNLFDRKNILNVYPNTGSATTDGWFESPFSVNFQQIAGFVDLYTALNYKNGWAYNFFGSDIYAAPRQIRFGVEVGI